MPATVNPSLLSSPDNSSVPSPSASADAPSRKRPRSDMSSEERKEARAHRNRIAAQNSRDRRKAHYNHLEQRIAELEEENRQLRVNQLTSPPLVRKSAEDEQERDKIREKENEELRERIKTLEKGWDAVVKALAAQGLPGIPIPPSTITNTDTTTTTADSPLPESPLALPVIVPNLSDFAISPSPSHTSLSSSSFDFEFDVVQSESTRHLAAGGQQTNQPQHCLELPQQLLHTTDQHHEEADTVSDAAMEDLFREILAPSTPSSPAAPPSNPLPVESVVSQAQFQITSAPSTAQMTMGAAETSSRVDWESELEMQRLLAMLPDIQSSFDDGTTTHGHGHAALEFDFESEWDMDRSSMTGMGVGVF